MKHILSWLAVVVTVMLLQSCKTQNVYSTRVRDRAPIDSAFWYRPDYQYVIRKDDKVSFSVWGQVELSVGSVYGIYNSNEVYGKWLLVDANGNIEIPKYGTMQVVGYTIPEMKDTLRNIYKKWIVDPVVDVKILNKEITIMGEVRSPSVIHVDKDNNTLLEMITRTGGFDFYADLRLVRVLRQDGPHVRVATIDFTRDGNYLQKNIQLQPGDMVIVPSKRHKAFDKRISTIVPFSSTATAAAILMGAL